MNAQPVVHTKMKDGTTMVVDLRTRTEFAAFYRGTYDEQLINILRTILCKNSYFLDIGANIGFYATAISALIKSQQGAGHVLAFEPFEGNYMRLCENIKKNNLENYCTSFNIGLSNVAGNSFVTLREDFFNGGKTGNTAILIGGKADKNFKLSPIKLDTLDGFLDKFLSCSCAEVDIIKMDIEGHEDICLKGAIKTIETYRPTILMEVNKAYYRFRKVDLDEVFIPMIPKNYVVLKHTDNLWKRIESFHDCQDLDNVFIIPIEKLKKNKYIKIFGSLKLG